MVNVTSNYRNTCRGLFEKHKLLFSFHMCMKILDAAGKVNQVEYSFLLKGGVVLDKSAQVDNPNPSKNEFTLLHMNAQNLNIYIL